jgi:hypothetical protein
MPFESFYKQFNELAWKETRSISVFDDPWLGDDDFGLIESYCSDENCDCRRVFFNVMSRKREKIVAVVAYGWEDRAFYADWYGENDEDIIQQLQGPILDPGSSQSEIAPVILEKIREMFWVDPKYIDRLKRHYRMFKEKVDPKHFPKKNKAGRVGRV